MYIRIVRGKLRPGTWSEFESAYLKATAEAGAITGLCGRWLVQDSVRWSFGAAKLFNGDFLEQAPNATGQGDALFGFTDVTWTF